MRFPTMWYVPPVKPQISLRIRAVWAEPLLVAWIFYNLIYKLKSPLVSKALKKLWSLKMSIFEQQKLLNKHLSRDMYYVGTRNVSMGHGCPRYCQIRINKALSLTKGHNSYNYKWILSIIELDLYFMITYLCMKYESNTPTYSKDITRKPFFIRRSKAITLIIIGGFVHNRSWPVFYDYIPVYEVWIQYSNVFKRYRPETICHSEIKGHNSDNNWLILSVIKLDLYFMIIYLCMKYESISPMYSKDIARKPFFVPRSRAITLMIIGGFYP